MGIGAGAAHVAGALGRPLNRNRTPETDHVNLLALPRPNPGSHSFKSCYNLGATSRSSIRPKNGEIAALARQQRHFRDLVRTVAKQGANHRRSIAVTETCDVGCGQVGHNCGGLCGEIVAVILCPDG
jgi:hypothetical protein